ncbi:MAG: hypothetical protein ACJ77N_02390 [Chloroflexota bacterium]
MHHARRLVVSSLVLAALTALALGSLVTTADTSFTHSGAVGVHYLADSAEFPAVRCTYNGNQVISSIRVRSPFAYARNSSARLDTQGVAWFFRIQAMPAGGGTWTNVATSAVQTRTATDADVASFRGLTKTFVGSGTKQYRALVFIRWLSASGATVGQAEHRADWYSWEGVPSFKGSCPGGVF